MIYYTLSVLMLAGIRDVSIITTPHDQQQFRNLLGDVSRLGFSIVHAPQTDPRRLAERTVRLGVDGSWSVTNSMSASTVKIRGVQA